MSELSRSDWASINAEARLRKETQASRQEELKALWHEIGHNRTGETRRHKHRRGVYRRVCAACPTVFYTYVPKRRYCCQACQVKGYNAALSARRADARKRTCEHCGNPFQPARADGRFCSDRCRQRHHRYSPENTPLAPVTFDA